MEEEKIRYSYHIGLCVVKQGLLSPVGDQAGIKKLVIRMRVDSDDNDPETNNGTTVQTYGVGIPPKETTATTKKGQNS